MKTIEYPHPGETLLEDFMNPLGITPYRAAKSLGISQTALAAIVKGTRAISSEMALRLEAYTGASAKFWLNLQSSYDLAKARSDKAFIAKLREIAKPEPVAA
jgi:addiction module HigA family antidote